ncbi:hypothetical protein C7I84_25055 [Mesorhizobium ephedrae]|uniref:Uncharacterized protein n=1 Tax=Kumtagia ephedrae TaxID=2116701 RepID=A0A2P7RU53_9HYPH|nr:hypothetical protein C7I84_25055 [Mesorhizobium ephedrae]
MVRTLAATAWLFAFALPAYAQDERPFEWLAGAYSFSDELGGFVIDSVSGTGTRTDPIVIRETFVSASPATLVIRARRPIRFFDTGTFYANGILHMRILARNGSGHGWVEFEFELQEILHKASVFGDGLSFDQRSENRELISSDSFAEFSRDFEPYDKLLFRNGKIDPGRTGGFSFLITDFTPRSQFYLVQDPRVPST